MDGPANGREIGPLTDRTDPELSRRKPRDRSIALVLIGTVALMPPMIGIPLIDAKISSIPLSLLYILAVWALLIIGAAALARPLQDSDPSSPSARDPDPTS